MSRTGLDMEISSVSFSFVLIQNENLTLGQIIGPTVKEITIEQYFTIYTYDIPFTLCYWAYLHDM